MASGTHRGRGLPQLHRVVDGYRGSLIGTTVVAYLLAFSRWGSHVNVGATQLYLTDILLLLSVTAWWRAGGRASSLRRAPAGLYAVLAIPVAAAIWFAARADVSIDAVRDLAPYIYAGSAIFALAPRPADAAEKTFRILRGALITHLVWVTVILVAPSLSQHMPHVGPAGPESQVLSIRPDFASACFVTLAVTAAHQLLLLRKAASASRGRMVTELVLFIWCLTVTLKLGARSGLITLMVAVVLIGFRLVPSFRRLPGLVRIGLVVATVAALVVVVPRVHAFTRLAETVQAFGIGVDPGVVPPDATGTAHARLEAWRRTFRYTNASTSRQLVGVGFGPNFLHDSGAELYLVGKTKEGTPFYSGVRAPHNFLLNTYARMGLAGLAVVMAGLAWVLAAALRLLQRSQHEMDVLAVALFGSILIVAMLGVVLESPFGSIPAFWAAGWIVTRRADAGRPG